MLWKKHNDIRGTNHTMVCPLSRSPRRGFGNRPDPQGPNPQPSRRPLDDVIIRLTLAAQAPKLPAWYGKPDNRPFRVCRLLST